MTRFPSVPSVRSAAAASALLVAAPVSALVATLALRDRLPDPLPRHWDFSGAVDGTTALTTFAAWVIGAAAALAALGLFLVWGRQGRQVTGFSASLTGWLVWFFAALYVGTLLASVDAARAEEVGLPIVAIVVALALSTAVAALLTRLVPAVPDDAEAEYAPGSRLELGENERIVWVGTAGSRVLLAGGVGMVLLGVVIALWLDTSGLVVIAVGLLLGYMSTLTARIDEAGVRVTWGPFGWPAGRTALAEIESVAVAQARPGEWGGWGYRSSARGTAHLVRAGEALVLGRRGRRDLLITVDGAAQGRDVLEALLERHASLG